MHTNEEDAERLASYADVLAGELPGTWTSTHLPEDQKDQLDSLTDRVWDLDTVAECLAHSELRQAAVLTRPDGAQFAVLDLDLDGYLIAAVAPRDLPDVAYRTVTEPNGFALSDDPFLEAENVAANLLPRYETALAQVRFRAVGDTQPSRKDQVILTWQKDGSLAAVEVSPEAASVLTEAGFVRDAAAVYRLSGDDSAVQARTVRAIGFQLSELGITTSMHLPLAKAAPSAAPTTRPAPAAAPPSSVIRTR